MSGCSRTDKMRQRIPRQTSAASQSRARPNGVGRAYRQEQRTSVFSSAPPMGMNSAEFMPILDTALSADVNATVETGWDG